MRCSKVDSDVLANTSLYDGLRVNNLFSIYS